MSITDDLQRPVDPFADELCGDDGAATEALMRLAEGLDRVTPTASLRARLIDTAAATSRLERFTEAVGQMLDLGMEAARAVMAHIDDASRWLAGPGPASSCWVTHGPSLGDAITGFVRVPSGATFPAHTHLGPEKMLILQGICVDGVDGGEARSGDVLDQVPGTTHDFHVPPGGPDLLYLTVIHEGVDIGGTVLRASDRPSHA
jgi:hypothetical protein